MSKDTSTNVNTSNELDWIRIQEEFSDVKFESFKEKLIRKTKENPTVPIGVLATTAALSYGLWNFYKGNVIMSQYMMRARVAAQGFTLLSVAIGFIIIANKENK